MMEYLKEFEIRLGREGINGKEKRELYNQKFGKDGFIMRQANYHKWNNLFRKGFLTKFDF